MLMKCFDCPRNCGVDRSKQKGFCLEGELRVAKVIENFMWEEPCLTGEKGVLAIFFSGCNLRCKFCQNYKISHIGQGKVYTPEQFADFLKQFDMTKFWAIDLITPTHFSSKLAQAFSIYRPNIPIIWNSSGYEKAQTIEMVSKFVDIFLVDFKYVDKKLSTALSCCNDYYDQAIKAIEQMCKKKNIFDGQLLRQGTIIRHLILPGCTYDSLAVIKTIAEKFPSALLSIMSQFTPIEQSPIKRRLKPLEAKIVLSKAEKLGLQGYFQDIESSDAQFIPKF